VWGIYHGNVVEVKGDDGKYYHMFHNSSLNVAPGQRVSESQLVSKSGATGKGVTGSHVHWGVAKKTIPNITSFNDYINPESTLSSNKEHDMPNEGDVHNTYQKANGRNATPEEVQYYITKTWNQPDGLYYGKTLVDWQHAIDASQKPAGFTPVNEQLYKKD
jgi:murein DD-endopeptidase MepM/ murein hydrolase activator NlpD